MVIPGERITVRHRDLGQGRVGVDVVDARGQVVLGNGLAEIGPA